MNFDQIMNWRDDSEQEEFNGTFVRHARQRLAMTQEEFAEALFMARESISRYENGARVPERTVAQIQALLAKVNA